MLRTQSNAQILGFLTTMPDLGNLLNSPSLPLSRCPNLKQVPDPCDPSTLCSNSFKTLCTDEIWCYNWDKKLTFPIVHENETCNDKNGVGIRVLRRSRGSLDRSKKTSSGKCLEDYVRAWVEKKAKLGVRESEYFLPFLAGAPRLVECLVCHHFIYPEEEVLCSVRGCEVVCHLICAKERLGFSTSRKFKCPQHTCFICKKRSQWRCVRCIIASHDKCAAWLDKVFKLEEGRAVCWRHPTNWRLEKKEVFCRLPLPYIEEEFKINITWKDVMENKMEPPRYIHIRRNVYLVKKKRDGVYDGIGCTNCSSICSDDCVCRVQCISCSKACHCSEICTNRPFRKEKKIKVIKTEHCGWGVEAAESINKGDFVIEYIGEVIDDALCEQRLWDMKFKGVQNFYMCEIRKDFTIDATFKGNSSRFLNHSCDPNCILEKWQVEGETRVGVFAARSIEVGEPLTYDYRFVQFGPEVKCYCGAPNCQGYLGTKRKIGKEDLCYCQGFLGTKRKIGKELCWGSKRRRSTACFAVVTV